MARIETLTIMGVERQITISEESHNADNKHCTYLDNGFCTVCDCDKCEGGYLIEEAREARRQGLLTFSPRECDCVQRARNRKRLSDSGLESLINRCTFDSFCVDFEWQSVVMGKAIEYLQNICDMSFFISGQSGCGKTHICTAICNEIMIRGGRLKYLQWTKDSTRLKQQLVNEPEQYRKAIDELIRIPYLYLDDLFKQDVTNADIRLAYEIINGRYNASLPVIVSSERSLDYIRQLRNGDGEAIAGRIFETCGKGCYCIELTGAEKNLRFAQF